MPGPGYKRKPKANRSKLSESQEASGSITNKATVPCLTLEEDEMTRCKKPATQGHPSSLRCKEHQSQYKRMYEKYKKAAKLVDDIKQGQSIPTPAQIAGYNKVGLALEKARFMRKYVEAIRVERAGRDIHGRRFFLKVDDGHKIRLKVLAKEMIKGVDILDSLQSRAYELYLKDNPLPAWASPPDSSPRTKLVSTEDKIGLVVERGDDTSGEPDSIKRLLGGHADNDPDSQAENADLIDLELRSQKAKILHGFQFLLEPESVLAITSEMLNEDSEYIRHRAMVFHKIMQQYALRIIFYEPTLFMKSLGKVSLKDLILGDDFTLEDLALFSQLFSKKLGIALLWLKDSIIEALTMAHRGSTAANVGNTNTQVKILDGWIFNVAHEKKITDEVWKILIEITEPPADVENRFVRICNTYDDLIGFLSAGALGMVPPPRFCAEAVAYRNHLSLAGVIIADMVSSSKPPALCGPVPSTQRAKRPGHIVWAELETRAYIFGAVRNEPDAFTDSFLNELKARPDLFHYITHSESDPIGKTDVSGGSSDGPLPYLRFRNFEAPRASPDNRPTGHGNWTVPVPAMDIIYGKDDKLWVGYLTQLARGGSTGWFFHFKKFKVKYFVVIDPIPNRHHKFLAQQLAWTALRVKGYGEGEYDVKKYAKASDTFFDQCAAERLAWMPKSAGGWKTTKMSEGDKDSK